MNKEINQVGFCDFCLKPKIKGTYKVYRIGFVTNKGESNIGILHISEELSDYLFKRGCHLSATQVMLLRPDIMLDFLKIKYNTKTEKILEYYLGEADICKECFPEHAHEVPEK